MTEPQSMSRRRIMAAGAAVAAGASLAAAPAPAAASGHDAVRTPEPTIALVHGAFADGSSWAPVVERLQRGGYTVQAVANPLRGLAVDAAYVRSVLASLTGPVVVAGHSYGGAVVTEAADGLENVKALVYVAAFVPDAGEVLGELAAKYPGSELQEALSPVPAPAADGTPGLDLYLRTDRFRDVFAADVSRTTAAVLAAAQRPLSAGAFTDRTTRAAWRSVPSWNLVATRDRGIPPRLQRFQAERAGSRTVEVASSHLPLYSRPGDVAALIRTAARTAAPSA
ncbi:alpha/beta hydrolase [Streptomyces sp. NPDC006610]|jgi:pimeloyl-ACP methyl ester carboxylesterase|uniref:alpha/beta fold hydrolase n=1 Tax=Streptomyces sp. NPDC006610 TaxID=3154584 RepID=UPI0033BF93A8